MIVVMRQLSSETAQPGAYVAPSAKRLRRARQQGGQGLAEYGLVLALVAVIAISAMVFLGGSINGVLSDIGNGFGSQGPGIDLDGHGRRRDTDGDEHGKADEDTEAAEDAQADETAEDAQADEDA